jgi:hypothetical protein
MGRVTTVLALRSELAGQAGQYGFGEDASAPVPTDPEPADDGSTDDAAADGAPADDLDDVPAEPGDPASTSEPGTGTGQGTDG